MKLISIGRFALWAFLGVLALGALLSNIDPIGYRVDWNIPFQLSALHHMATGTDGFVPWNYANLGSPLFYPTLAPFLGIVSLLSYLFPSAGLIERLIVFAAVFGSAEAMYRLCLKVIGRVSPIAYGASIIAGMAFATGTFFFNKLSQGVLQESVGYAMLPIVANLFIRSMESSTRNRRIALAMMTGLAVAFAAVQPQYAVLAALVFMAIGLYHGAILETVVAALSAVAAELFAVLPAVASLHQLTKSFQGETPGKEVITWAPPLLDAIRQSGYAGNFDQAAIAYGGSIGFWYVCGFLLFAVALIGFMAHRTRWSRLLACALCGTVIWAAMPKLYAPLYQLMLDHVPLAMMFRESYRFVALTALLEPIGVALAILWISSLDSKLLLRCALAVAGLAGMLVYWLRPMALATVFGAVIATAFILERRPSTSRDQYLNFALGLSFAAIIIIGATPFAGYGLPSQVQYFVAPASSYSSYNLLARQPGGGRVLYLPFTLPMRPAGAPYAGTDPTISWAPKESFGNYMPSPISKRFAAALYNKNARETAMEADWLDLRYVDARYWIKGDTYQDSAAKRTGRFATDPFSTRGALNEIQKIGFRRMAVSFNKSKEVLFKRTTAFPSRFSPGVPTIVSAGLNTAAQIYKSGEVVAFTCQNSNRTLRTLINAGSPIVVEGASSSPIMVAFAASRYVAQPGRYAVHVNADQGWASLGTWNSWWWLKNSITGSPCDIAMVAHITSHRITLPGLAVDGNAQLLVEYWKGPTGGFLHVGLGKERFTLDERAPARVEGYHWAHITAQSSRSDQVTLSAGRSGDSAVAEVALIPTAVYSAEERQISRLLSRTRIIHVLRPSQAGSGKKRKRPASLCRVTVGLKSHNRPTTVRCGSVLGGNRLTRPTPFYRTGFTTYSVGAVGAGTFLLNTAFSPTWKINGAHSIHFVANGYSNGWLIPRGRNSPHEIWNQAALLLTIGELLSGAFVIFVVIITFVAMKETGNAAG